MRAYEKTVFIMYGNTYPSIEKIRETVENHLGAIIDKSFCKAHPKLKLDLLEFLIDNRIALIDLLDSEVDLSGEDGVVSVSVFTED